MCSELKRSVEPYDEIPSDCPLDDAQKLHTTSQYAKFSESDLKKAYIDGYELGHDHTVESCYTDSEECANDYISDSENFA
jgi:hypothetical protein